MERNCKTCAWWSHDGNPNSLPFCHYDPFPLQVSVDWWCRHWSSTTGWENPSALEQAHRDLQKAIALLQFARPAEGLSDGEKERWEMDVGEFF